MPVPDSIGVLPSGDPGARPIATDTIEGVDHQLIKQEWGRDGIVRPVDDDGDSRFPVGGEPLERLAAALEGLTDDEATDAFFDRLLDVLQLNGPVLAAGSNAIGSVRRTEASIPVTLPVGAAVTDAIDMRGYEIRGIQVPGTLTGTILGFLVSSDGRTFATLYDMTNTQVTMTVTAGRAYAVWGELAGWSYIKLAPNAAQAGAAADFLIQVKS